ncbi:MAG: PcfJ domain-containing protein [bacterium]|nr:PcfJ domain-containing protein [bacterium]
MKRKTIEKVPYLTLPRVVRKERAEYAARTALQEIGGEEHLLVEIYRNRKECRKVPTARIAITRKDFGTFFPESGTWSRNRIADNIWNREGLIWKKGDWRFRKSGEALAEENVLYSAEDLKRIKAFTDAAECSWRDRQWWDYLEEEQKAIRRTENREREARKRERRQQALKEREENTAELPEQRILSYAEDVLFRGKHYLYYKKHGNRVRIACSCCGGVSDVRWKGKDCGEPSEKWTEEPRKGMDGTCPLCSAGGTWFSQGRAAAAHTEARYLFLGQKYRENGLILRYIEVEKEWQLKEIRGEKGPEMARAGEELSGIEIARTYFEPGRKPQTDYHKHNEWTGKDFWDDCNLSGMATINIRGGRTMPETYPALKDTFLRYSALKEYQEEAGDSNPDDYLKGYLQTPQIEMLTKLGLTQVVGALVSCRYGIVADINADRADTFLGIRKERLKQLCRLRGDLGYLEIMQMEKRLGQEWTDSQLEQLEELKLGTRLTEIQRYMSIRKFLNRVAKYAGCGYGTGCGTAAGRLQHTARIYLDYLSMRRELGYNLGNTVYLFPRDLNAAHAGMVAEQNRKEADARIREVNESYSLIRKQYRQLRKRFFFEDGEFCIRPARDAGEIVTEGRVLHHCVGSNGYLEKHNGGVSVILFLRFSDKPDIPYITVEINPETFRIIQWYGAHDRKPDRDRMQKWLDAYTVRLKCGGTAEEAQRVQVTA